MSSFFALSFTDGLDKQYGYLADIKYYEQPLFFHLERVSDYENVKAYLYAMPAELLELFLPHLIQSGCITCRVN